MDGCFLRVYHIYGRSRITRNNVHYFHLAVQYTGTVFQILEMKAIRVAIQRGDIIPGHCIDFTMHLKVPVYDVLQH